MQEKIYTTKKISLFCIEAYAQEFYKNGFIDEERKAHIRNQQGDLKYLSLSKKARKWILENI